MAPDTLVLFAKALLVGLLIAAPVGAIGLLTIQRTLDQGMAAGLATGLGAAAADTVYGAIGALGITQVMNWLVGAQLWLSVLGGGALLWIAWHIYRQPVASAGAAPPLPSRSDLARCFAGTFLLTLSNPSTIFSFMAVFASIAGARAQAPSAWPMIAGVATGSALWWLLLSAFVSRWRHRFDATWRRRVNHLSALLLGGFAVWQWSRAWVHGGW